MRVTVLTALALLVTLMYCSVAVEAQGQRVPVKHYPMTLDDFAPYMPPEYLAQLRKLTPEQQRVWAWKQTDEMIAKGLIKRRPGWQPFSETLAEVAEDFVPGAGKVVRQATADIRVVKQNAGELIDNPSMHNLAKTVRSAAAVPIEIENGSKQVLKDNADRILDRNDLKELKPLAHRAIDAAVMVASPIPGSVGLTAKVAGFVEKHTDDDVLVCSVGAHEAAAAASKKTVAGKSLVEIRTTSMVDHAVDADVEQLWKTGVIPQHSCHYVPGKALTARGLTLPPKSKSKKALDTRNAKALTPGTPVVLATDPAARAVMEQPEVKNMMQQYGATAFKPKFVHPALRGLGAVAVPAAQDKQKGARAPKASKSPANKSSKRKF